MEVRTKVEAIGDSEVGNRQEGNIARFTTLLAARHSPQMLNRKLSIPPFY